MRARLIVSIVVAGGVMLAVGATLAFAGKPGGGGASTTLYPDLRTVVPAHLNLVNQQQNEYLRFSNGIANTGAARGRCVRIPSSGQSYDDRDPGDPLLERPARVRRGAETADPCYTIVSEQAVSIFEYHATHNHWHTADVALLRGSEG